MRMHVRARTALLFLSPLLIAVAAAYVQWGLFGLTPLPAF
jgi:hypothetical protein